MKSINSALIIVGILLIGGGAFYGGMTYGQKNARPGAGMNIQGRMGTRGTGQVGGNSVGMASGEVLSNDGKSITIKLRDGGSKIVFFSTSTQIQKMATGTTEDLKVGENVMATGEANADGSIAAQSVQLRPVGEFRKGPPEVPAIK